MDGLPRLWAFIIGWCDTFFLRFRTTVVAKNYHRHIRDDPCYPRKNHPGISANQCPLVVKNPIQNIRVHSRLFAVLKKSSRSLSVVKNLIRIRAYPRNPGKRIYRPAKLLVTSPGQHVKRAA
jgi:hypothetical protein